MAAESAGDTNWREVAPNIYIDTDGIAGREDTYGYSFLLKSYNKGQYEPINGINIEYTLSQYTIDCDKQTYKIGLIDSYDKEDNFVFGDYNRFAQFQPIVSDTAISFVSKMLCKQ